MKLDCTASSLLLGAALIATAGCVELDLTNPNQQTTDTFWQNSNQAVQAVNATYNALQNNGAYGRWQAFNFDIRSDIGFSPSPWADLSNYNKFTLVDYDFEVSRETWQHHYGAIFRANQAIANVPNIDMETALRDRLVGEAKFIRALLYFNLVNLYGGNIPLITEPSEPDTRPASSTEADVYTQIETDLTDAAAALPPSYAGGDVGRATRGAALALLGKAHLQQRDWAAAATALQTVTTLGYDLIPSYAENFTAANENNRESVFEVQFGDRSLLASGVRGLNIAKMVGPCGPSFCDGRPTQWYFDQFQQERTTTGAVDPRLDVTIFYNKPGGMDVYGQSFAQRYGAGSTDLYFKKYGEYYIAGDQDWDAAINYRVIRYADVLLMLAEALNEQGQAAAAKPLVDRVRARVDLAPLPAGLSQAEMRDRILHERLLEFGLVGQRFLDLKRHNLLTPALEAHDPEFAFFTPEKSERLPIPVSERNLNPGVNQNPGW